MNDQRSANRSTTLSVDGAPQEPTTEPTDLHKLDLRYSTGRCDRPAQDSAQETEAVETHVQLSQVLDAATQLSICATDMNGIITLFNSGAEQMLGYQATEVVGQWTPEIMHVASEVERRGEELSREFGREIRGFEVFVASAKAGKFERREWTYVRKDGQHFTVNLVVTAVRNAKGEITGFLGVAEDISERKRSEKALRKSEERFDLAVAGSNDGIWDWDVRTNEVYYAPRFKELLGFRDDEFDNTFAAFEAALHPDDRQGILEQVQRHLKERAPYDVEYRLLTKCGEYGWFRARGQAIWDEKGQAIRMAGSLTDVTERKQAEVALGQNATEIQHAYETLRVAEAEARKAVDERDKFLAMLSHELRNPLSAIRNGVGVLGHVGADREAIEHAREAIQRQVHHVSCLLDDLLDVARVTQGKIGFRPQLLDLHELLLESAETFQPLMEAHGHEFSVFSGSESVTVKGDPTRLMQIIENLLTNAAKYTSDGGKINAVLDKQGAFCELCVRDSGRGIDPDLLEEIFDMFFQSNQALDRSEGGMGVGLTLVRALVEMHGGTISAQSDGLGKGSRFVVRLPLAAESTSPIDKSRAVAMGGTARVLLIEDNQDSREMLQTLLRLDGHQVESVEDGRKGLDAILQTRPDIAVIDIGLPVMDGYEVARRVRKHLSKTEVLLVALTGYGQEQDLAAAYQAGFDEHFVKPVDLKKLKLLLQQPRKPR